VTHHVELVLPGADYLVRMLDGRIDTQGTIKDLRAQGVLESIVQNEAVQIVSSAPDSKVPDDSKIDEDTTSKSAEDIKKPRKLIEDEHREVGGVKWSIYKTYLQASYVLSIGFTMPNTKDLQMVWHMGHSRILGHCQRGPSGWYGSRILRLIQPLDFERYRKSLDGYLG
jgi:hypothetical protein